MCGFLPYAFCHSWPWSSGLKLLEVRCSTNAMAWLSRNSGICVTSQCQAVLGIHDRPDLHLVTWIPNSDQIQTVNAANVLDSADVVRPATLPWLRLLDWSSGMSWYQRFADGETSPGKALLVVGFRSCNNSNSTCRKKHGIGHDWTKFAFCMWRCCKNRPSWSLQFGHDPPVTQVWSSLTQK